MEVARGAGKTGGKTVGRREKAPPLEVKGGAGSLLEDANRLGAAVELGRHPHSLAAVTGDVYIVHVMHMGRVL